MCTKAHSTLYEMDSFSVLRCASYHPFYRNPTGYSSNLCLKNFHILTHPCWHRFPHDRLPLSSSLTASVRLLGRFPLTSHCCPSSAQPVSHPSLQLLPIRVNHRAHCTYTYLLIDWNFCRKVKCHCNRYNFAFVHAPSTQSSTEPTGEVPNISLKKIMILKFIRTFWILLSHGSTPNTSSMLPPILPPSPPIYPYLCSFKSAVYSLLIIIT